MLIKLEGIDSYLAKVIEGMRPVAPQSAEVLDELREMIKAEADRFHPMESACLSTARAKACGLISSARVQSLESAGLVVIPKEWVAP